MLELRQNLALAQRHQTYRRSAIARSFVYIEQTQRAKAEHQNSQANRKAKETSRTDTGNA